MRSKKDLIEMYINLIEVDIIEEEGKLQNDIRSASQRKLKIKNLKKELEQYREDLKKELN